MDTPNRETESTDLSALAWVNEELRRSLGSAHKALRRFLMQADAHPGADEDVVDASVLRTAKSQIHQGVGALELLGMSPAAVLLRACESALAHCITKPESLLNADAVDRIERAFFALMDYLARLLAHKPVSPLSFFPQYQAVQELAKADRIHPADLWGVDWSWHDLPVTPGIEARQPDPDTRSALECHMLAIMRTPSERNFQRMSALCGGLAAGAPDAKAATLWQLASAVFEAQSEGLLRSDLYSKRLSSRLLSQLRILEGGGVDVSERLAQDLLFFCANAALPPDGKQSPLLAAARSAWGLRALPVDYHQPTLGKFDPAMLAQAGKRVAAAKDAWSAVAGGEMHRMSGLGEQFALVADSLRKLYQQGDSLAAELQSSALQSIHGGTAPDPALAMEVATALLYIEASLEDGEVDTPEQGERVYRLADRIGAVRSGQAPAPLEAWMEQLYRRVSDRQTLGSVVQELRATLSQVEKLADQFSLEQDKPDVLHPVSGLLTSMRGVLSVVGLDQASAALLRMRDDVDALVLGASSANATESGAPLLERLAANLGALDFLIGMLSVQPQMAKALFIFDAEAGILTPVMGREVLGPSSHETEVLPSVEHRLVEQAQALADSASRDDIPVEQLSRNLEMLFQEACAAEQLNLVAAVSQAKATLDQASDAQEEAEAREQLSEALVDFAKSTSEAVGLEVLAPDSHPDLKPLPTADEEDDEMREIFLEEAKGVIVDAQYAVSQLSEAPDDVQLLTTLRRAFHTLKGSSRMVGLNIFGEGAWVCEQIYNGQLGDHKPADDRLLQFTGWALKHFEAWVRDIESHADGQRTHQPVVDAAKSLEAAPASLDVLMEGEAGVHAALEPPQRSTGSFDRVDAQDGVALDFNSTPGDQVSASGESGGEAERPAAMFPGATEAGAAVGESEPALGAGAEGAPVTELAVGAWMATAFSEVEMEPSAEPVNAEMGAAGGHGDDAVVPPEVFAESECLAPESDEGGVKVIGNLTIGIPLLKIYLAEADELSRRLSKELAEWSHETDQPISSTPIALAHSLSGSSATVGFTELSMLAGSLEHAQMRSQSAGSGTPEEAQLFPAVAEEIQRLLHQFAGGVLPTPNPELLQRLADHERVSAERLELLRAYSELDPVDAVDDSGMSTAGMGLDPATQGDFQSSTVDGAPSVVEFSPSTSRATAPSLVEAPGVGELRLLAPLELRPASVDARSIDSSAEEPVDDEDDIDAVDAVDAELFPIFEEEGMELLPCLATQIRDWAREPGVNAHGAACMRTLHTIKGGARLAGAMRLGEMAHRLETRIEKLLGSFKAEVDDIEVLNARSDALMHAFEHLRLGDQFAHHQTEQPVRQGGRTEPPAGLDLQPENDSLPVDAAASESGGGSQAMHDAAVVRASDTTGASVASPGAFSRASSTARSHPSSGDPLIPMSAVRSASEIDWSHFGSSEAAAAPASGTLKAGLQHQATVRVRAPLLDRLVNQAGEVSIARSRMASGVAQVRSSLTDLTDNLDRLRQHLRDIELQGETQMASRIEAAKASDASFDPLEFDRFTRFQEVTRMMAESVNDVATVQRNLNRALDTTEDELAAQGRTTRNLQDDLLRTRMVEFDSLSDRFYRVVRQAAKETGKQVRLDVAGATIEVDRGVLERMTGAFEHLLRNSVTHGIEAPEVRLKAGKDPVGNVVVVVTQEGNEVSVTIQDDGAGLDLGRIRRKGLDMGLLEPGQSPSDVELANLIFTPGLSTADQVTDLAGRGIGMDVVRSEVNAIGGRIDIATAPGNGASFKLQLPLTTAVTQIVMMRVGQTTVALPSTTVELIRRARLDDISHAYASGGFQFGDRLLPFFWLGSLLQLSPCSVETAGNTRYVVIVKSAQQRIALHVDEVFGNQEAIVKNLGPQLVRLPGLAGVTLLASGEVALIYNPIALAALYGDASREATNEALYRQAETASLDLEPLETKAQADVAPLVLVVDDSLTVRRVTQRLLLREGYRVALAKDGLDALEKLAEEKPCIVLSDIEMPRMDGFDLVRNIRGDARLRDLAVIMITSRIAQKHRDYAAELGVDHYLGKPYSEDDLLALISRYTRFHSTV